MSDNNKCSCNHDNEEENSCTCNHDHDSQCNCGCDHSNEPDSEEEFGSVEYEDENGNIKEYPIVDCFSVDGTEYVLIQDIDEDTTFMLKVEDEELVNPSEEEFDRVTKIYYASEEDK